MHLCRTFTASLKIILLEEVPDGGGEHDGDQAPPDHVPDAPSAGLSDTAQAGAPPVAGWLSLTSSLPGGSGLSWDSDSSPDTPANTWHFQRSRLLSNSRFPSHFLQNWLFA